MKDNYQKFLSFREEYPVFHYDSYNFCFNEQSLTIQFHFRVGAIRFQPEVILKWGKNLQQNIQENELQGLIFHIGLIELISYWKCCCAPTICIHPYRLNKEQENWWRKVYWHGLGEFFYLNQIKTTKEDFFQFSYPDSTPHSSELSYKSITNTDQIIVPIGGGKDSVVTLEHYRKERKVLPFIINPRGATLDCAKVAGFNNLDDIIILKRTIDPQLLQCNAEGYLNGHTPFSAMLAFYTLLVSYVSNTREIALSNEASANEATVLDSDINHQYSKSLAFEEDFRSYVKEYMADAAHYFSYLRPFSELEIAKKFAQYKAYHPVFKSCNAGSKENIWCCECPKCLFAYIILSPYLPEAELIAIFGENLLKKASLQGYLSELKGETESKPFECVGTVEEVLEALRLAQLAITN